MAHATLTTFLSKTDQILMGLNLLLLLMVSLLPFTTNLMASHLGDPGEHLAVVVFGVNLTLASVMVNIIFRYAARTPGLADQAGDQDLAAFARRRRIAVIARVWRRSAHFSSLSSPSPPTWSSRC